MRLPRPRRARPDGGAVGDDPEGEVDGDAAAAEVPRALVPRVGLQEVPEAVPPRPSLYLPLPPASGSAVAEVEFPGCGESRPAAGARAGLAGRLLLGRLVPLGFSGSLPLTSGPVLPIPVRDSSSSIPVERSRGRRPTRLRRHHGLGDRRRHARAERGRSASAAAGRGRRRRWAHRRPAISR